MSPRLPADEYRYVAAGFTDRVRGVPTGSWDNQSPVTEWKARDVVRHLVEWFPPFLKGGSGIDLAAGLSVDDDPIAAWTIHSDAVQAVLDAPAADRTIFSNPHTGEMPLPDAVDRFYTADVFMHTWDLARATGQDETLDPAKCTEMLAGMLPIEQLIRDSGQYGPRVAVPQDADVQTKLLGFIGRDPLAG